eukprot:359161-Chlamydomonas_euryale.AAC.1
MGGGPGRGAAGGRSPLPPAPASAPLPPALPPTPPPAACCVCCVCACCCTRRMRRPHDASLLRLASSGHASRQRPRLAARSA